MNINALIYGAYDPHTPNADGTFTVYTGSGGMLWYVKKSDIRPIGEREQKLVTENERLKTEILSLKDEMAANKEKLYEIENAFEVLKRYL